MVNYDLSCLVLFYWSLNILRREEKSKQLSVGFPLSQSEQKILKYICINMIILKPQNANLQFHPIPSRSYIYFPESDTDIEFLKTFTLIQCVRLEISLAQVFRPTYCVSTLR